MDPYFIFIDPVSDFAIGLFLAGVVHFLAWEF